MMMMIMIMINNNSINIINIIIIIKNNADVLWRFDQKRERNLYLSC